MGILNVTPDSFSDGGAFLETDKAVAQGLLMAEDGVEIIDIGGESTRPGSLPVSEEEEIRRILPVVKELRKRTSVLLSVDTSKAAVARRAVDAGADIINDVSAMTFDPGMVSVAVEAGVPVVLMHMRGTPRTMQDDPSYGDLLGEICSFFSERIQKAKEAGIKSTRIVIDPGIGFGKTTGHNLSLIDRLDALEEFDCPILAGVSRKAFIGKILNVPVEDRLEGGIAAGVLCIVRGAHILRVHDVKAMRRAADMADAILSESSSGRKETGRPC